MYIYIIFCQYPIKLFNLKTYFRDHFSSVYLSCKHNSHQVSLQSYNPIAIWNPMEIPVQLLDRRAGVYRTRTATPARPSTYCARIASQLRIAPGFKTAVMAKK